VFELERGMGLQRGLDGLDGLDGKFIWLLNRIFKNFIQNI
jgi:hypothetical protein